MEPWQMDLKNGFKDIDSLLNFLQLPRESSLWKGPHEFPLRVPQSFALRMEKGNPSDPLLLQVLPQIHEVQWPDQGFLDAVGDLSATKQRGLIQKYQGRVLLLLTGACAIHCRYCFRRNFPYEENVLSKQDQQSLFTTLAQDPNLHEVIFSGGDPLILKNNSLFQWAQSLKKIPHLRRWRLHSRLPSVLPSRIDSGLIEALLSFNEEKPEAHKPSLRQVVIVTHINHPAELNFEVIAALKKLKDANFVLLNQSVLLRGINDHADTLVELSETLFSSGVLPYYLHGLDRAKGTLHFEVDERHACQIYDEVCQRLPGYLAPKFVREIEGAPYKQPIHFAPTKESFAPATK